MMQVDLFDPFALEPIRLERTLGFEGAVIALDMLRRAELRIEKVPPPPRDNTALAWSMKLRSSRSLCLSRKRFLST